MGSFFSSSTTVIVDTKIDEYTTENSVLRQIHEYYETNNIEVISADHLYCLLLEMITLPTLIKQIEYIQEIYSNFKLCDEHVAFVDTLYKSSGQINSMELIRFQTTSFAPFIDYIFDILGQKYQFPSVVPNYLLMIIKHDLNMAVYKGTMLKKPFAKDEYLNNIFNKIRWNINL